MSLTDLVPLERADVLPGYTLSAMTISDLAQLQRHFEATHLATAVTASESLSRESGERLLASANEYIGRGAFQLGLQAFSAAMWSLDNLPAC